MAMRPRFTLGTASFNGKYGLQNTGQQVIDIAGIISTAESLGIHSYDMADTYDLDETLMCLLPQMSPNYRVNYKIFLKGDESREEILDRTNSFIEIFGVNRIDSFLLHNPNSYALENRYEIKAALETLLNRGHFRSIGASIYEEGEINLMLEQFPFLRSFQIPDCIADRRLSESEKITNLTRLGITFSVRSIFLQGLLISDIENLPSYFEKHSKYLKDFDLFAERHGLNRLDLCIAYAKSLDWAESIIIGVNSGNQLREIVNSQHDLPKDWKFHIPRMPYEILDPRKWQIVG